MSTIPDPGPSLTAHDTAAARLLGDLQGLVQTVRGYGSFLHPSQSRRINPTATLPTEFLLAVAVALDSSEKLRNAAEITGDQIRDVISFCRLRARRGRDEAEGRRHRAVREDAALRGGAGRASRLPHRPRFQSPLGEGRLFPHLENMKCTLGRGPKKKAVKAGANAAVKTAPKE